MIQLSSARLQNNFLEPKFTLPAYPYQTNISSDDIPEVQRINKTGLDEMVRYAKRMWYTCMNENVAELLNDTQKVSNKLVL